MATPSTVAVGHPEMGDAAEPQTDARRLRRVFRRRARGHRALRAPHAGWRDEATLRATTRV
jgi:hypothetical protein